MFACLVSRTFSVNQQYFSLTTNQRTVLSVMAYQPNEQDHMCSYSKLSQSRVFSKPAMTYQLSEHDLCVRTQNCLEVECSLNPKPIMKIKAMMRC
jgi:hypothetical protein